MPFDAWFEENGSMHGNTDLWDGDTVMSRFCFKKRWCVYCSVGRMPFSPLMKRMMHG